MKRRLLILALVCLAGGPLSAEQPQKAAPDLRRDSSSESSSGSPSLTPEMWFYQQERTRFEDPKAAVRRKAEYRAAQRESRMAALHWMGIDPSRPYIPATPYYTPPVRPYWSISYNPYTWRMLPGGMSGPSLKYPF